MKGLKTTEIPRSALDGVSGLLISYKTDDQVKEKGMLIVAFIFLIIAIISGFFGYRETRSTDMLIAKVIFYFSLTVFLGLLMIFIFSSTPHGVHESTLPI